MLELPLHALDTARHLAAPSQQGLSNLQRTLAEAPAALAGFEALREAFAASSLTPLEREVVYAAVAKANQCHYCTAHAGAFDAGDEAAAAVAAIHAERPLGDRRLQTLRRFAVLVARERGWVPGDAIEDLLGEGFTRENVLDVVCGVALVTMSSYTNHIAATPLEVGRPARLVS